MIYSKEKTVPRSMYFGRIAVGKTTVARVLSEIKGIKLIDCDKEIWNHYHGNEEKEHGHGGGGCGCGSGNGGGGCGCGSGGSQEVDEAHLTMAKSIADCELSRFDYLQYAQQTDCLCFQQ